MKTMRWGKGKRGISMLEYMLFMVVLLIAAVYGVTQKFLPQAKNRMNDADTIMTSAQNKLKEFAGQQVSVPNNPGTRPQP